MSSDISHRIGLQLKMRLQTLRMPYHVTYAYGQIFPHIEIADPDLPIHCATCMASRLR